MLYFLRESGDEVVKSPPARLWLEKVAGWCRMERIIGNEAAIRRA